MRTGLFILLMALPLLAWSGAANNNEQAPSVNSSSDNNNEVVGEAPATDRAGTKQQRGDSSVTWVDQGHAYTTNRVQAMTEWMDSFFGDPVYDLEKPESLVRLAWENTWDQQDDHKTRLKLRGKLRLPGLSKRLNLVFSGDEGDELVPSDTREDTDAADLVYNISDRRRSRLDLTLGLNQDGLKPGVRFRNQGPIADAWGYRYTQRVQWEDDEGFFTTGQFNLDHVPAANQLIRWSNRAKYGEETQGIEWRSALSLNQRIDNSFSDEPSVISLFTSVHGVSDPSYIENVRFGTRWRQQLFRRYFFVELEPSYNFRKRKFDDDRDGVWNVVLRFEILFETSRQRSAVDRRAEPAEPPPQHDGLSEEALIAEHESE